MAHDVPRTIGTMVLLWYGGTGTSIGNLSYTWDANKNKTSETIGGTMRGYGFTSAGTSYDDEDCLTGYATCSMSVPPMVNNPTHELLTAGGQSLEADSKGMSKVLSSSLIPQASQLTPVTRTGTGGSVVYVQHDQQTIADYPVGGVASTPTNRYVYASYIDEPVVRKAAGTSGTIHYHRNQQYSITAMTTSSGAVAERYAYTAYGQPTILNASGSVLTSSAVGNRYTYTGREWDETLGLHHFRARWMSPLAGRFLGRDPIGYADSRNVYVVNFAMKAVDPTGKIKVTPVGGNTGEIGCESLGSRLWKFTLDSPAPCDGFIVQHVSFLCQVRDCENCKCANNPGRISIGQYWEAWEVKAGEVVDEKVISGESHTDRASAAPVDDKCGRKHQDGHIHFYCKRSNESPTGVGTGDLKNQIESPDWGYGRFYGDPECGLSTGKLYSTGKRPDFWGKAPLETAVRTSSLNYQCCKGGSQWAYFWGKP